MDRRSAEEIMPMLVAAATQIARTIDVFEEHASKEQASAYRHAVGKVMLEMDGLMRPIFNEYPDLHP